MAFAWYYETAKETVSLASKYITTAYTHVVTTASHLAKTIADEQLKKKEPIEIEVPIGSQISELAQNSVPDPTGFVSMNMINRHASLLDEDDADEWDDAYLRPDVVTQDKAYVVIYGYLVENGDWVYLLGSDRQ
jgi:hypothetical protein